MIKVLMVWGVTMMEIWLCDPEPLFWGSVGGMSLTVLLPDIMEVIFCLAGSVSVSVYFLCFCFLSFFLSFLSLSLPIFFLSCSLSSSLNFYIYIYISFCLFWFRVSGLLSWFTSSSLVVSEIECVCVFVCLKFHFLIVSIFCIICIPFFV